jgi:homocysteine S-methyltransferase
MAKYRSNLPQLGDRMFLTDSGLETTLIFHDGIDLPHFASIALHDSEEGERRLRDYFVRHIAIAKARNAGFILESTSWRASPDWGAKLGYSPSDLIALNRKAIALLVALRDEHETPQCPMPISGNIGPRGDGYSADRMMTGAEAMRYHAFQCDLFADTEADLISGFTMTHSGEAIGIARAAAAVEMPVVISFTTETDGRLPSGETMREAIEKTDDATSGAPAYYMINCAHPTPLRGCAGEGRSLADAAARIARQCIDAQSCRTRQFDRSRCRRSGRSRPPLRQSAWGARHPL